MIKVLAQAAGMEGMVGGQYIDIQATDSDMSLEELKAMHSLKTGALIRASLALGGIAAGASEEQLEALDEYGTHIGLAFQVVDDILDVEGDSETLGKTAGKDNEANKPTYVKLMGLEGAKAEAQRLLEAALGALSDFGESADHLRDLARYIVDRDR
jgi:geranylgeranyl pyrophosphate synthase